MLTRILGIGVLAGALAGLFAASVQPLLVQPMIEQAELRETAASGAQRLDVHQGEDHDHPGAEEPAHNLVHRGIATFAAMISTGIGYGLLLSGVLGLLQKKGLKQGVVLGILGFVTMQVAPSIGAPPQPPGTPPYDVHVRQMWWLLAVGCTSAGLGLGWKAATQRRAALGSLAVLALVLPHAVRPILDGMGPTPEPAQWMNPFVLSSFASSAVLWLCLGGIAGWLSARHEHAPTPRPRS
jgi:cobalt transporter subunit CbtA